MAQLILADAGDRMAIVSEWFQLGPLQEAEKLLREEVGDLVREAASANTAQEVNNAIIGSVGDMSKLTKDAKEVAAELVTARVKLAAAQEKLAANGRLVLARSKVSDYDALIKDGLTLKKQVDTRDGVKLIKANNLAAGELSKAVTKLANDRQDERAKKQLVLGKFDGTCPVAHFTCPVPKEVTGNHARNVKLMEEAMKLADVSNLDMVKKRETEESTSAALQELTRMENRLADMRERAQALRPEYLLAKKVDKTEDSDALFAASNVAMNVTIDLTAKQNAIQRSILSLKEALSKQATLSATQAQHEARLATYREAIVIFGKQGAQRRVAEGALSEIEQAGNAMLTECGIELSVEVQWSRVGKDLASTCDACGHPYPKSATVKQCVQCKTERGPNLVNKLEIVLSDQSGAAEDLGGAAIQLAASAWLRRARMSAWDCAMMDEPFGQLDASHRKSFAMHLVTLLSGKYGFRQSLVISHDPQTVNMFPGRIEIVSDGKYSTVKVAA